ncbi:MAG: hypothetical protein R3E89_11670 [Thiolinea sp.]
MVRWHVIAMFAPFHRRPDPALWYHPDYFPWPDHAGAVECWPCWIAGLFRFYAALILLGLGWNFGFIGATTLLATVIAPEDRGAGAGVFNDFCVFGLVMASFSSGGLLNWWGWEAVQWAMPPFLLLAAAGLIWLTVRRVRHD